MHMATIAMRSVVIAIDCCIVCLEGTYTFLLYKAGLVF